MKKFIKDLRMLLPKDDIILSFVIGAISMFFIMQITYAIFDARIVTNAEYDNLKQHCTAADSLINSIDTNYTLDVLSELPIYDEYMKTLDLP